jgi:hypothetical protein
LFLLLVCGKAIGQTPPPCGLDWLGGIVPPPGTTNAQFNAAGGTIPGVWFTTNPTTGSFNTGRPNYQANSFYQLFQAKGGGSGSNVHISFDAPVQFYQILVKDLRGDPIFLGPIQIGLNNERQEVRAYNNGTPVELEINSLTPGLEYIDLSNIFIGIVGGNTTTTSTNQAGVRVKFNGPIDSITIKNIGSSDFVIIELLCPDAVFNVLWGNLSGAINNNGANLKFPTYVEAEPVKFEVERSVNGVDFEWVSTINGNGNSFNTIWYQYSLLQNSAIAYYRIKMKTVTGTIRYSNVIKLTNNLSQAILLNSNTIYNNLIDVYYARQTPIGYQLINIQGKILQKGLLSNGTNTIEVSATLPSGIYFLKTDIKTFRLIKP